MIGTHAVSLEITPGTLDAYWHVVHRATKTDEDADLSLGDPAGWTRLEGLLRQR